MFAPARSPITKQRSTKIKQGNFRKFISAQNKGISMAFFGPGRSIRLTNYYRLYWNSVITFSVKKWYQNRYRNWVSIGINGRLSGEIRRPFGALGFYATYCLVVSLYFAAWMFYVLVGRLSILGQRKSCGPRARPRKRDEEAETTAWSHGYSFLNSQLEINTYNSPPSRSTFYSEIAP